MSATRSPARPSSATRRKMPGAFPEATLTAPVTGLLQIMRSESWDPATVRVVALHLDGQGLRLEAPIPIARGARLVVNMPLRPAESVHLQGVVNSTRKLGNGSAVVVRFENQTQSDRKLLSNFIAHAATPPEQPLPLSDKRRYQRFLKSVPVQYQHLGVNGKITPGEGQMMTLDIGGGGMRIRVEQKLTIDDLLYLHLPLDNFPFFSLGRVIWLDNSRIQGRMVAGLQFVDLSETEQRRLIQLLSQ